MYNHFTDYVTSITSNGLAAGASSCVGRTNHYEAKSKHERPWPPQSLLTSNQQRQTSCWRRTEHCRHTSPKPSVNASSFVVEEKKTKTNYEENDTNPNIHCHTLIYIYLRACDRVPWVWDGKCVHECVHKVREEEVRSLLVVLLRRWPYMEGIIPVNLYIYITFISCPAPCVVSEDLLYHLDLLTHLSIHSHSLSPYIITHHFVHHLFYKSFTVPGLRLPLGLACCVDSCTILISASLHLFTSCPVFALGLSLRLFITCFMLYRPWVRTVPPSLGLVCCVGYCTISISASLPLFTSYLCVYCLF